MSDLISKEAAIAAIGVIGNLDDRAWAERAIRSLPPAQDAAALDLSSITRVVLVDYTKREGTFQTTVSGDIAASIDVQDAGRTLKIFVNKRGVVMGEPCFECHAPSHARPCKCDTEAEIARLQAEVDRLTKERDEAREGWHVEMPNAHSLQSELAAEKVLEARRVLGALRASAAAVKVKPLAWEQVSRRCWDADGMGKLYRIIVEGDGAFLRTNQYEIARLQAEVERLRYIAESKWQSVERAEDDRIWNAALEAAAKAAEAVPHYTKQPIGTTGLLCDISTPPSDVAKVIRSLKEKP